MLTVDDYGRIRRARRDGMSLREIARTFHHSRRKIREVLSGLGEPAPYPQRKTQSAPRLKPFHETILKMLQEDESAPPKQRHMMTQVHRRLQAEHGFEGSYSSVRRFILKHRQRQRETFIPLDHEPGQRIEADFGVIHVDFPEGRRKVNVLILVWSYSNAPFAIALPTQRTEAILEGMTQAFEFFGCVPQEVWWDNPKTVAARILTGRDRKLNPRYAALASHYVFDPLFCMPAKGNEKPVVENRVKTLQRRWSTPVPKMKDLQELNRYLRDCCLADQQRVCHGKQETIGSRLEQEKQQAITLPKHRFDPCIRQEAKVGKYQFARFDNVNYSVPRYCAFQTVSIKGYVDRVEIVFNGTVVATHVRSYEKSVQILEPRHYLVALQHHPAALDHSNVYRNWRLPAVFDELRERLEKRHGLRSGVKQYVRVLQLLARHPIKRVQQSIKRVHQSIEQLRGSAGADAAQIIHRVERCATAEHATESLGATLSQEEVRPEVLSVEVPCPSLNHFDQFLPSSSVGEHDHEHDQKETSEENRSETVSVEKQPQTIATSDHERGVRETGPRGNQLESDVRAISVATERTGSGRSQLECLGQPHQTGSVPRGKGSGELRLFSDPIDQQAAGVGTCPLRMGSAVFQCLSAWPTGNG